MVAMLGEKLRTTLFWSLVVLGGAMLTDYGITIGIFHDHQAYSPLLTFCTTLIIGVPAAFVLVSGRVDLRHARDELAAARDAAVNANLTKSQFFSNMSHELRTPLNAILGFSELLALDAFAERRVEYAGLIHNSGAHLLGLVDDLLDLSRIEAGRLELKYEAVDLRHVAEECIETLAPRARQAGLCLVTSLAQSLPELSADRRAVKQMLLNLLTNAVKFSTAGGTVELFGRLEASGELAFGVRDEGIGISAEDQARVFERFGQVRHDVTTIEKGTGLGLPIVKGLAEAHGGRIALESAFGEGTRVTIWLPKSRLSMQASAAA